MTNEIYVLCYNGEIITNSKGKSKTYFSKDALIKAINHMSKSKARRKKHSLWKECSKELQDDLIKMEVDMFSYYTYELKNMTALRNECWDEMLK